MKIHSTLPKYLSLIVLLSIAITACSPGSAESAPEAEQDLERSFYTSLIEMEAQYGFNSVEAVELSDLSDDSLLDEGAIWQTSGAESQILGDVALKRGGGLWVEFSFDQPLDNADNALNFVLGAADESAQAYLSSDGLQLVKDGQPAGFSTFQEDLDWQPNVRYVMFLYPTDEGGLQARLWDVKDAGQVALLATDSGMFSDGDFKFDLKLGSAQSLTLYNLWKMVSTADQKEQAQTASVAFTAALADYQIQAAEPLTVLECEGRFAGQEGVFTWTENTNEHCNLSLRMGQALAFDFVLSKSAQSWSNMAYLMLDANLESMEMPVKNLGIPLANDRIVIKQDGQEFEGVGYSDGFELAAGQTYSALVLMNEEYEFQVQIWPADDPAARMTADVDLTNAPSTWLPVQGEEWVMGMWLADDQLVTISNMVRYSLEAGLQPGSQEQPAGENAESSQTENAGNSGESAQLPDWALGEAIPNLNEFFIENLAPYQQIDCDDLVFDTGTVEFSAAVENTTHNCRLDLPEGSGFIFEFVYNGDNAGGEGDHLLDFAFVNGTDDNEKLIRYTPLINDVILKDKDRSFDGSVEGQINWETGRRYTLVFISSAGKYVYLWPSDDPQQKVAVNVDSGEWDMNFGATDSSRKWNLRIWLAAGMELQMQNFYQFEAH